MSTAVGGLSKGLSSDVECQLHLESLHQKGSPFYLSAAPAAVCKNKEIAVWGQSRSEILREAIPGEEKKNS